MDVQLIVSPGRAGHNDVNLYFFDEAGAWASVESVEMRFIYLDFASPATVEETSPLHPGHVLVSGNHLRHAGRWRIEAAFRSVDRTLGSVAFELVVP